MQQQSKDKKRESERYDNKIVYKERSRESERHDINKDKCERVVENNKVIEIQEFGGVNDIGGNSRYNCWQ